MSALPSSGAHPADATGILGVLPVQRWPTTPSAPAALTRQQRQYPMGCPRVVPDAALAWGQFPLEWWAATGSADNHLPGGRAAGLSM